MMNDHNETIAVCPAIPDLINAEFRDKDVWGFPDGHSFLHIAPSHANKTSVHL